MFSAKNCSNSFAFNSLWIVWRAKLHRHCKYLRPTSHHQVTDYVYAFNYTCIPSPPVYFYFIHFMSIYVNHTNNTTLQRCISRHLSKMMCDKYNLRYIYPHPPSQMYISKIRDRTISLEISYSHPHSSATMSL